MTPKYRARKYKKLTAQITKLTQQEHCVVVRKRKLEAPWRDTHNADPGGKKERMLTELTELTVTKNTPDLRTLVTTHQSWAKNNLPERKNLAHSSDRRGLQTVKEDELLCSLIRTAHEIHYR
jgi:hypothetical protein